MGSPRSAVPTRKKPRNARRRGELWEARSSLREGALEALEAEAEEYGRSGTRHRGLILEAWVVVRKHLTPAERAQLDAAVRNHAAVDGELLQVVVRILLKRLSESNPNQF